MPSEQRIKAGEAERNRQIQGPIQRAHVHDQGGCPACGVPNKLIKKWCYGIEPDLGRIVFGFDGCNVVGPHLHGECAVCGFVWLERTHSDQSDLDGRGALRFDEELGEGGTVIRTAPNKVLAMGSAR